MVENALSARMRLAGLVALAGLAALAVLAIVGRAPGPTALSESIALAMAEADFAPRAGVRAEGLAEEHSRRSAALMQQMTDMNIDFGAPPAAKAPAAQTVGKAVDKAADAAATKLVDEAFARAMADAAGKPVQPPKPAGVLPIFAATWEPKPAAAKKMQAVKRLENKAARLAQGPADVFKEADKDVQQLAAEAKMPVKVAAPKPAAPRPLAATVSALSSADELPEWAHRGAPTAEAPETAAHPAYWMQELGFDDDDKASTGPGGPKGVMADVKAHAARWGDRSEWLKALNNPGMSAPGFNVEQDEKRPTAGEQWQKALTRPMSGAKSAPQKLAAKEPETGHAQVTQQAVNEQGEAEPARKKPVQALNAAPATGVQTKPVTGEALLSDWMQALGLGPSPKAGPAGLKRAATPQAKSRAPKPTDAAEPAQHRAKAAAGPMRRPILAARMEPAPKAAAPVLPGKRKVDALAEKHLVHSSDLSDTGALHTPGETAIAGASYAASLPIHAVHEGQETIREWFAALHRQPASVFKSFTDGGDESRSSLQPAPSTVPSLVRADTQPVHSAELQQGRKPEPEMQKHSAAMKVASKQQQLAAKGAWAKALGGNVEPAAPPAVEPQVGTDMWGDVLVRVHRPMVPDAALVPDSVMPSRLVASSPAAPEAAGKAGDKGNWLTALHRTAQFEVAQTGRDSMLAAAPDLEARMRQALQERDSPRAVALEHATGDDEVDPFGDEAVPADQAAFRTLWSN